MNSRLLLYCFSRRKRIKKEKIFATSLCLLLYFRTPVVFVVD